MPLGEKEFIERFLVPLAGPGGLQLKDDCARLQSQPDQDLIINSDMIVGGQHFFEDDPVQHIGFKALAVNISDLISKGAEPISYFLSLALPSAPDEAWSQKFTQGLSDAQNMFSCNLLGGDTVKTAGPLTLSVTAIGSVPKENMLTRSGAREGDLLYVSGSLGESYLGRCIREDRGAFDMLAEEEIKALLEVYWRPKPPYGLQQILTKYASGAMDLSDGFLCDLKTFLAASNKGAEVNLGNLPLSVAAQQILEQQPDHLKDLITGGDDYQVLCAVPLANENHFTRETQNAGLTVTEIGVLNKPEEGLIIHDINGQLLDHDLPSFDHFK